MDIVWGIDGDEARGGGGSRVGPDGLCCFSGLLFYSQKFHLLFFSPSPLFLNYSYNNIL